MNKPKEVVEGNDFTEPLTWTEAEPTVEVKGPSQGGLKAAIRGGRPTISGRLSRPGRYEITIVQKRTAKITLTVTRAKSLLDTPVLNVLLGRRVPVDPPETP